MRRGRNEVHENIGIPGQANHRRGAECAEITQRNHWLFSEEIGTFGQLKIGGVENCWSHGKFGTAPNFQARLKEDPELATLLAQTNWQLSKCPDLTP
jgi:hypothetical protein